MNASRKLNIIRELPGSASGSSLYTNYSAKVFRAAPSTHITSRKLEWRDIGFEWLATFANKTTRNSYSCIRCEWNSLESKSVCSTIRGRPLLNHTRSAKISPMTCYVAFLRAINVGGHNVKMGELRTIFESLGLSRVKTFIAGANQLFRMSFWNGR